MADAGEGEGEMEACQTADIPRGGTKLRATGESEKTQGKGPE